MKALICSFLLAVFAVTAMADTDITGKWTGSLNVTTPDGEKNETAFLVLKQTGSDITGSVGPSEDQQFPIQKGKIEGDKITIEVDHGGHPIKLALVLAEDHMKGDMSIEMEGQTRTAKLDVTRVK
ncbi:MAG TPA: hypothetical protein VKB88_12670 [Bryobacteraceae bacterium]|nr:hypothetical protein [Bryobacteraceae bacterium]